MKNIITISFLFISAFGVSQSVLNIQTIPSVQTPIASTTQLGLVKIGDNLFIDNIGNVTRLSQSGGGNGSVLAQLNSTNSFATFSIDTATIVIVTDTITRGLFSIYVGTDSADGGMVFNDGIGRKWKRLTKDDKIHLRWYGLVPRLNYVIDDAPVFRTAIKYIKKHPAEFKALQLDPSIPNTWYLLGSNLDISGIKLLGAGGNGRTPSTFFQVLKNVQPFYIAKGFTEVRDINVRHYTPDTPDSSSHSFIIRGRVKFKNVNITTNSGGNGYQILGDDSTLGSPRYSVFLNSQANFCHNGVYIKGKDAGNIIFELCNFTQNRSWGAFDIGQIGNIYLTTHFATNSQNKFSGARTADIRTFYPYPDSVYNIKGKHPDLFPTYWYRTNFTGSNELFDSTRQYTGGGALYANNPNAANQVISNYTEDFQANSIISPKSTWYEGTAGSPVVGGIWQHTFGNTTFFSGIGGIESDSIITKTINYDTYINDSYYSYSLIRRTPAIENYQYELPIESGTITSARSSEFTRDPTVADIPLNTFKFWSNITAGAQTLKLWVNVNGILRILKTYTP